MFKRHAHQGRNVLLEEKSATTVGAVQRLGRTFRATNHLWTLEVLNKNTLVNFCMYCFGLSFSISKVLQTPTEVPSSSQQEEAGGGQQQHPGQVFCSTGAPFSETLSFSRSFCYQFFGKRFCLVFQGPPVETWPRPADCITHKTYKSAYKFIIFCGPYCFSSLLLYYDLACF